MVTTGIRKVAVPIKQVDRVKELAWRVRLSRSELIRAVIDDFTANPEPYKELPDMEGIMSGMLTLYVPDQQWLAARDVAYNQGRMPISVFIRRGLRAWMEREGIPDTE